MTTRNYSSRSQQTTLTSAVTAGASTMVVQSGSALLGGQSIPAGTTFTIVLDPDTAIEEIVDATAVSTNTFTITRGIDGSSGQAHSAGAVVRHMAIGRDYRESNAHVEATTGVHGISNSSSVVGTIDTQTLTNKTLTAPTITNPSISGAGVDASIVFEGATADAYETTLTVVDPTQDNTLTMPNTTGTIVVATAVQTLTNKTLTSPTISGSPVITGLSSAGMSASSATPKDYVDSILGSATSAATSAASAATSAASAATSAGSSETSAIASASSATASASSATAAATSATSAAASATAAATSATSAAASATTAANSVATIAGYATSSANSATAAATSATSAAASATAAATSAASAFTSASSALTSATSAATSYDEFDDRYLGAKATPPTVDNDGNALITGALYWNTAVNKMYVWSGTAWGEISSSADIIAYKYTVAGGATSVSGADDNGLTLTYTVGKEQVYINGVLQVRGSDYTATTGSSITGISAMVASDIVTVLAFTAFSVSNTYTQAEADAKFFQNANAFVAGKNRIINGQMLIDQRATSVSITNTSTYSVDRWKGIGQSADGVFSLAQDSSAPAGFAKSLKATVTTADASIGSTQTYNVFQSIEGQNVIDFDWGAATAKTVTLSFWVRSSLTGTFGGAFRTPGADRSFPFSYTINAADTWEKKSYVVTGDTSGTWLKDNQTGINVSFSLGAGTDRTETAGSWYASNRSGVTGQTQVIGTLNATWYVTGVQVELGSVATAFSNAGGTIAGELAACQRYFYRMGNSIANEMIGIGAILDPNVCTVIVPFPVELRTAPTFSFSAVGDFNIQDGTTSGAATAIAGNILGTKTASFTATLGSLALGRAGRVYRNGSASGSFIQFSSEL